MERGGSLALVEGEEMKLVLDPKIWSSLQSQTSAARYALDHGMQEGDLWGIRLDNEYFSVKFNRKSIRVYPQPKLKEESNAEHSELPQTGIDN